MINSKPNSLAQLVAGITPDIYQKLKAAVELGKWDSGDSLSQEQTENCLQAIIAYENANIEPQHRVGYIKKATPEPDKHQGLDRNNTIASDQTDIACD